MIIVFNKATNPNITDIKIYSDPADICYWSVSGGNSWAIDTVGSKIICGGEGSVITFANNESMKPYLDQYFAWYSTIIDPATTPILKDLHQDKPSTGGIVSHTYHATDVEKDFINKGRQ